MAEPRLTFIPCDEHYLQLLIEGGPAFEAATGWHIAPGYLDFPEALLYSLNKVRGASESEKQWWQPRLFLLSAHNSIVGLGGYKGPAENGAVEIGYSVAPEFQGQGLATEAAVQLSYFALQCEGIEKVRAHTLTEPNASTRVLQKSGFKRVGEVYDRDDGYVWAWEAHVVPKAYAYILRGQDRREVLVFRHRDFPEAGVQVPGGTIDEKETPSTAILREIAEESGLTGCHVESEAGVQLYFSPEHQEWQKRHFFVVNAPMETPDTWDHTVSQGERDKDLVFCFEWWPLERATRELAGGKNAMLEKLKA